jgi:hypothetical protein
VSGITICGVGPGLSPISGRGRRDGDAIEHAHGIVNDVTPCLVLASRWTCGHLRAPRREAGTLSLPGGGHRACREVSNRDGSSAPMR